MVDLNKTIDGFAYWIENEENGVCYIPLSLCEKIMKLLKEQEAIEPINSNGTFRCGNCNHIVGYNDGHGRGYQNNYCSCCGILVKWND
jgi:hypothetical protein